MLFFSVLPKKSALLSFLAIKIHVEVALNHAVIKLSLFVGVAAESALELRVG